MLRPEKEADPSVAPSFFRYAAEFRPLSAVWRNQDGSFEPREAAISCLDISSEGLGCSGRGVGLTSARDAIDCGLDLNEPVPLDNGRCCHDNVPLRDRAVAFAGGLGIDCISGGGRGRDRERSTDDSAVRPPLGDMDPARPCVCDLDGGVRATGGSIPAPALAAVSPTSRKDGVGPVFEGDRERARSVYR